MSEEIKNEEVVENEEVQSKKKKFFSLKDKYVIALLLGIISAVVVFFTKIVVIELILLGIAFVIGIYQEIKENQKTSKKVIGVLIAMFLVPFVFSLAYNVVIKLLAG